MIGIVVNNITITCVACIHDVDVRIIVVNRR